MSTNLTLTHSVSVAELGAPLAAAANPNTDGGRIEGWQWMHGNSASGAVHVTFCVIAHCSNDARTLNSSCRMLRMCVVAHGIRGRQVSVLVDMHVERPDPDVCIPSLR